MILRNDCLFVIMTFISSVQNETWPQQSDSTDVFLDSLQFISKYSGKAEKHFAVTKDGYVVTLFRIPRSGPPVLLAHGIGDSSDSWLVLGPKDSLAYHLAEAGFDVWLYNARGNKYSKRHAKHFTRRQYWNFSFEEMGTQDLPATIDYILLTTFREKLSYVGFSQGTTIFLIMCSLKPNYNDKIERAILLAPVAWISNVKYPFTSFFASNLDYFTFLMEYLTDIHQSNLLHNIYHAQVCRDDMPLKILCQLEYFLNFGLRNITNLNTERLPVISSHIPAGASSKTYIHFLQMFSNKRFQRFSYNNTMNMKLYTSYKPPEYDVRKVRAPVFLFSSEADWFSNTKDVNMLRKRLPNIIKFSVFPKKINFSHLEFVYGSRVRKLIVEPVKQILLTGKTDKTHNSI